MSSGFNLGQSGNATENGAGVVKLATQQQIDNGEAFDGGVPLVATPDKLPRADAFFEATAGEDIAKGQPVIIGDGLDSSTLERFEPTGAVGTDFTGGSRWFAQRFQVPVGVRITNVAVKYNWVQGANATIAIRDTLTGPDLCSGTVNMNATNGSVVFRGINMSPQLDIVEGQDYYVIFRTSSGSINTSGSVANEYPTGEAHFSTNAGASWSVPPPQFLDMSFQITGVRTQAGLVYLAADNVRLQFAGFAQADAVQGATVTVNTQNYLVGLFDGVGNSPGPLTIGQKYYFSTTAGELATSGSNILAIAPTTEDLIRLV